MMHHPTHPAPRRTSARAFTIIELLVVVSIIVLLVSLLMPALQKVRSSAKAAACANNQRQLSAAVIDYTAAYEKFPLPDEGNGDAKGMWFNALDEFLGAPRLEYAKGNVDRRNYLAIKQDPAWAEFPEDLQKQQRTIKMNHRFSFLLNGDEGYVSKYAPTFPGKTVLFVDGRGMDLAPNEMTGGAVGQFNAIPGTVGPRHEEGCNVAFADNHVEHVWQELKLTGTVPAWYDEGNPFQTLVWSLAP